MKITSVSNSRMLGAGAIAIACLFAFPESAEAKGSKGKSHGHGHGSSQKKSHSDDRHDSDRNAYSTQPRSRFVLSLGNGYAGRGYYYGPPNSSYYYQRSDVRYYATREAAPREYYSRGGYSENSADASVQRALARQGYYDGFVDGRIGPQSQRSISRYQQDHGLQPTGFISSGLLRSLGLQ